MEPDDPLSSPPRSPFGDPPQSPRLGIIHLLVGTTLVACYFSYLGSLRMQGSIEISPWSLGCWSMSGLALGGLLLFVARRSRGMRFPVHPGETLWILLGIESLHYVAFQAGLTLYLFGGFGIFWYVWRHTLLTQTVLFGMIYLVAARRTTIRRWRIFFFTRAVCYAAFLISFHAHLFACESWSRVFPGAALAAVVLTDALRRQRYPWSHWVGVAISLWLCAETIAYEVYYTFFWEPGFWEPGL